MSYCTSKLYATFDTCVIYVHTKNHSKGTLTLTEADNRVKDQGFIPIPYLEAYIAILVHMHACSSL